MENDIIILKKKFYEIKDKNWIQSTQKGFGGIGLTFEKLMGISNNELEIPDFNNFEIKTKTKNGKYHSSLFNCTPTGPHYHEVERIKNLYGYPDREFKKFNILNASICANKRTKIGLKYFFQLKVDRNKQKIYLMVFDKFMNLIEEEVYWDFGILKEKLYRKLKYLAYVKAVRKKIYDKIYFKYYQMKIYKLKNFDTFIDLIEKGIVIISLKIGIFKDSEKLGKIHDHGTSFRIDEIDLEKLYELIEVFN